MPEEPELIQNQNVSKFNAGIAQIMRIDILWRNVHHNARTGNFSMYNASLDAIWRELAADSNPQAFKGIENFKKIISKNIKNKNVLYQILSDKEIFLRKLQNDQGKGTAYQDGSEDDMS